MAKSLVKKTTCYGDPSLTWIGKTFLGTTSSAFCSSPAVFLPSSTSKPVEASTTNPWDICLYKFSYVTHSPPSASSSISLSELTSSSLSLSTISLGSYFFNLSCFASHLFLLRSLFSWVLRVWRSSGTSLHPSSSSTAVLNFCFVWFSSSESSESESSPSS